MSARIALCHLDDLPLDEAKAFTVAERSLLVLRLGPERVRVYLNRCPHLGTPLHWEDGAFLDAERAFIRCATHGALFEKDSGLCVLGPCRDEALWHLDSYINEGLVYVDPTELPAPRVRID
ncbi:MAG: Rieske (2Fe-2S) protein [Pseudomonadales bacterium]|nr:Rieske (2Fe-2S) protein [Pseudomonadales bacterium]